MGEVFTIKKVGEFWKLQYVSTGPRPGELSSGETSTAPKGRLCQVSMTEFEFRALKKELFPHVCETCQNSGIISYDMTHPLDGVVRDVKQLLVRVRCLELNKTDAKKVDNVWSKAVEKRLSDLENTMCRLEKDLGEEIDGLASDTRGLREDIEIIQAHTEADKLQLHEVEASINQLRQQVLAQQKVSRNVHTALRGLLMELHDKYDELKKEVQSTKHPGKGCCEADKREGTCRR